MRSMPKFGDGGFGLFAGPRRSPPLSKTCEACSRPASLRPCAIAAIKMPQGHGGLGHSCKGSGRACFSAGHVALAHGFVRFKATCWTTSRPTLNHPLLPQQARPKQVTHGVQVLTMCTLADATAQLTQASSSQRPGVSK